MQHPMTSGFVLARALASALLLFACVPAAAAGKTDPAAFDLGARWIVREHAPGGNYWEGVWVRRGNTNVFDATWRHNVSGQTARDVLEVRGLKGNSVEIFRRGIPGTYRGPLAANRRSITRGTATWYTDEWWEARIEKASSAPAPARAPAPVPARSPAPAPVRPPAPAPPSSGGVLGTLQQVEKLVGSTSSLVNDALGAAGLFTGSSKPPAKSRASVPQPASQPAAPARVAAAAASPPPPTQGIPPPSADSQPGVIAVSMAPFEGFRRDRLADDARRQDARFPWNGQSGASSPPDVQRLATHGATVDEAMRKLQLLQGKAPAQTLASQSAIWAPFHEFPTAQNQQYFDKLVPSLDDTIAAANEIEALAPAFRESLVDLASVAATGNDQATRVALRASAAQAEALEKTRQRMQEAARRVRQLGDPQNPLAAQQAARTLHRSALSSKPAAPPPPVVAKPAASDGPCTNPYGDCPVTNVKMVSTAPQAGQTVVIPNVPMQPTPYSGPDPAPGPGSAAAAGNAPPPGTPPSPDVEAISHHEELARQRELSARRWEADAQREKDPVRKKELLDRAGFERDMGQAERDLAASLRTGTLVHTRTAWQDRQTEALVGQMKVELTEFDKEHRRLSDIPRLAAMISGADGVRIQGELQQRIHEALLAPDRGARLDQIYGQLKRVVTSQKDADLGQEAARVARTEANLATVEGIKAGADAALWAASWLVPGAGSVSMFYGVGVGFAEGDIAQGVENAARSYSEVLDVGLAAVHGARELDESGQRKGLGAGLQAGLSTAVLNKITNALAGRTTGLVQKGIAKGATRPASDSPPPRPEAFKSNQERYSEALKGAKTPAQREAVEKKYGVVAAREALHQEMEQLTAKHEKALPVTARGPDGSVDTSSPAYSQARQAWQRDMDAARARYAPQENRMSVHEKALAEAGLSSDAIPLSGGEPKSVMSDMDVAPRDGASAKKYAQALRSGKREVLDFSDRYVVPDLDMTIWKPGFSVDQPGTSSYESAVLFDALHGSDKFPTKGGVEYTTKSGWRADPEGAVLSNFKKAQEAGIGDAQGADLHVVGKSLDKATSIAAVTMDPSLTWKAKELREHRTAEEAGVTTFGLSADAKRREQARFLDQSRSAFGQALGASGKASEKLMADLEVGLKDAEANGDTAVANDIRQTLAQYRISNRITMQSLAARDPSTVAKVLASRDVPPPSTRGYGWLLEQMKADREALQRLSSQGAPAVSLPGVPERCRAASTVVATRLASARAGSPEAAYLAQLKAALDRGVANPGQAVTEVRLLSGNELAVVLGELAPARGK